MKIPLFKFILKLLVLNNNLIFINHFGLSRRRMYKKQGSSGINGAMGVLNNNIAYNNAKNGRTNAPKEGGYEPGTNYN